MRKNFKRSAVVGGTVATLFGVGIGFAAWTNYGEGTGDVTAETAKDLTVTVTDVAGLFPTGSVPVSFSVDNPNPYDVKLTKVELKDVVVKTGGPLCLPSVVTGSDVLLGDPVTDVVADGGTSASYNFPVTMSNAAHDDCQGAEFTVTLGVTALSN
jgi:hypothetical protein